MNEIKYIKNLDDIKELNSLIGIDTINCNSKEDLFIELNNKFHFPYFGFNWDSLWDVLLDLSWFENKKIIILNNGLPNLEIKEIKIYLSILYDLIVIWEKDEEFEFYVYFPIEVKKEIEKLIIEAKKEGLIINM